MSNPALVSDYRRNTKARAVAYLGGACQKCHYSKCLAALEFHHRDPSQKDLQISSGHSLSFDRIRSELDKCDLLCATCHREAHAEINEKRLAEKRALLPKTSPRQNKQLVSCPVCQESFITWASRINRNVQTVCSNKCRAKLKEKVTWPTDTDLSRIVWEVPVYKLAKQLGVSGSSVTSRCNVRGIPVPSRSYWNKKRKPLREKAVWPSNEDLFDMLWSEPATTVAKRLSVSSVAIKKRCKRLGIETPPRGYWAKLAAGVSTPS